MIAAIIKKKNKRNTVIHVKVILVLRWENKWNRYKNKGIQRGLYKALKRLPVKGEKPTKTS